MKQISEAINKVMQKVHGVSKNMTVGSGNSSYKGVADKDVKQAIREAMIENGLSLLPIGGTPKIQIDRWEQEEEDYKTKKMVIRTKQSCFTEIETRYLLLHTSGESIEVYGYGQGVDAQDKGAGKATTYALKNTLLNMFLIPTGVDTDDTHSDDLEVPKKFVKTQVKALVSKDESCPSCGVHNEIKKGTTKEGKPYERAECNCGTKYFINRKIEIIKKPDNSIMDNLTYEEFTNK